MKYYLFDHFLNCHLGRGGVLNGKFITQEQPKKNVTRPGLLDNSL